jgi:hypothetical protein
MQPSKMAIIKATAQVAVEKMDALMEKATHCSEEMRRQLREECLEFFIEKAVNEVCRTIAHNSSDN